MVATANPVQLQNLLVHADVQLVVHREADRAVVGHNQVRQLEGVRDHEAVVVLGVPAEGVDLHGDFGEGVALVVLNSLSVQAVVSLLDAVHAYLRRVLGEHGQAIGSGWTELDLLDWPRLFHDAHWLGELSEIPHGDLVLFDELSSLLDL